MRAASPVFPAIFRLPASPHHEPQGTQATAHIHNSAPPAREACRANAATQHTANATCSDGTRLWSRFSASANRKRPAQMPRSLDGAKAACDGLTRKPMPPMSVASARMSAENSRRSRTMNGPAKKGESTVRFLQNLPERNGFWERRCEFRVEFRGLRRGNSARRRRRVAGGKVWRRLRAGGSAGSGFRWDFCAARVPCSKPAGHQRRHAQGHDPEHQMTHHLGRAAHPHPASAVAALEQAVDALGAAALAKAARWRGGELPLLATARVVVDDRLVIL